MSIAATRACPREMDQDNQRSGRITNNGRSVTEAMMMEALRITNDKEGNKFPRIRRIVRALFDMAEAGDVKAARVIFDRIEGMPTQRVEMSHSLNDMTAAELRERIAALSLQLYGVSLPTGQPAADGEPVTIEGEASEVTTGVEPGEARSGDAD